MRQYILATTPGGKTYRWGEDETGADNVFEDLQDSDSVPGGYKELSCSLPRKPHVGYGDMQPGTKIELFGAGQMKVWEGLLQQAPRTSGDKLLMDPAAVGYQSHLSDDNSAQCIPIDADMSAWGEPSAARRDAAKVAKINQNGQVALLPAGDPKGGSVPAIAHSWAQLNSSVASPDDCESWYDAQGVELGRVMLDFLNVKGGSGGSWVNSVIAMVDDTTSGPETLKNFNATTASEQSLSVAAGKFFLLLQSYWNATLEANTGNWENQYRSIKVFDRSGIPVYGTWPDVGVLFSDVLAYVLPRWAPLLNFTTGPMGSIGPTEFPIPHLPFKEPTTVTQMTETGNRFELNEWAVWSGQFGPTFYLNPRGDREGRKRWRVRAREAQIEEAGPSLQRSANGVIVQWQDVDGSTKFVGPPGSGFRATDERLLDTDPLNPCNQIPGLRKWPKIAMKSKGTLPAAVESGQRYLEQLKLLDTSGEATLTGTVEDDHGARWPYYCVHAGDLLDPLDGGGDRYIVSATRTRSSRSAKVALDAPPDTREAMLERLDVKELAGGLA
jgi:hypothetical protein